MIKHKLWLFLIVLSWAFTAHAQVDVVCKLKTKLPVYGIETTIKYPTNMVLEGINIVDNTNLKNVIWEYFNHPTDHTVTIVLASPTGWKIKNFLRLQFQRIAGKSTKYSKISGNPLQETIKVMRATTYGIAGGVLPGSISLKKYNWK